MFSHDVFLSHSSSDKEWVFKLKGALRQYGIGAWLDKDEISPGERFAEALENALKHCGTIVLVVTKEALHSEWVKTEYHHALTLISKTKNKQIIPIIKDNVELPGFLSDVNRVNFTDSAKYNLNVWSLVWGITKTKPRNVLDIAETHLASLSGSNPVFKPISQQCVDDDTLLWDGYDVQHNRPELQEYKSLIHALKFKSHGLHHSLINSKSLMDQMETTHISNMLEIANKIINKGALASLDANFVLLLIVVICVHEKLPSSIRNDRELASCLQTSHIHLACSLVRCFKGLGSINYRDLGEFFQSNNVDSALQKLAPLLLWILVLSHLLECSKSEIDRDSDLYDTSITPQHNKMLENAGICISKNNFGFSVDCDFLPASFESQSFVFKLANDYQENMNQFNNIIHYYGLRGMFSPITKAKIVIDNEILFSKCNKSNAIPIDACSSGALCKINVSEGDCVSEGHELFVIECSKMETTMKFKWSQGRIVKILSNVGDSLKLNQPVMEIIIDDQVSFEEIISHHKPYQLIENIDIKLEALV